jgi:hypothetical protein
VCTQFVHFLIDLFDVTSADGGAIEDRLDCENLFLDILKLLCVGTGRSLSLDLLCFFDNAVGLFFEVVENIVPVIEALAAWRTVWCLA